MVDFNAFFFKKNAFFKIFRDFLNSPVAPSKIVKCTKIYFNTVGQTQ